MTSKSHTLLLLVGGVLLASLGLLAPTPATADVGVTGLSPKVSRPGEQVDLQIACGFCSPGERFPISLVPLARAPEPFPCRRNALCTPAATAPPRRDPFAYLGLTGPGRALGAGTQSHLRFRLPDVEPGVYTFVIFCAGCYRGPRGSLIVDTTDSGGLLRVRRSPAASIRSLPDA